MSLLTIYKYYSNSVLVRFFDFFIWKSLMFNEDSQNFLLHLKSYIARYILRTVYMSRVALLHLNTLKCSLIKSFIEKLS